MIKNTSTIRVVRNKRSRPIPCIRDWAMSHGLRILHDCSDWSRIFLYIGEKCGFLGLGNHVRLILDWWGEDVTIKVADRDEDLELVPQLAELVNHLREGGPDVVVRVVEGPLFIYDGETEWQKKALNEGRA